MARRILVYAGALLIAAGLQGTLLTHLSIGRVHPDLILVVVLVGGLLVRIEGAMILGFAGGLVEGTMVGISLPSFIISRLVPGYLAGLQETRMFRENLLVPLSAVFLGTILAEFLFMLFSPPPAILPRFEAIIIEAALNTALAPLVFLALLRLLKLEH